MVRIITGVGGEVLSNKTSKNTVKITHKIKVFIIGWGIKPTAHSTSYRGADARFISACGSQQCRGHLCTYKPGPRVPPPWGMRWQPYTKNKATVPARPPKPLKTSFNCAWKYSTTVRTISTDPTKARVGGPWHRCCPSSAGLGVPNAIQIS